MNSEKTLLRITEAIQEFDARLGKRIEEAFDTIPLYLVRQILREELEDVGLSDILEPKLN